MEAALRLGFGLPLVDGARVAPCEKPGAGSEPLAPPLSPVYSALACSPDPVDEAGRAFWS